MQTSAGKAVRQTYSAISLKVPLIALRIAYNKQHSSFLHKLPPEIRNKISRYTLQGHIVGINSLGNFGKVPKYKADMLLELYSLPQVTHQVHAETAKLVFRFATFRISVRGLKNFLEHLGQKRASLIQVLIVDIQEPGCYLMARMFRPRMSTGEVSGLKTLALQICRLQESGNLLRIEFVNNGTIGDDHHWCDDTRCQEIVNLVRDALEESASERKVIVEFTPGKIVLFDQRALRKVNLRGLCDVYPRER